MADMLQIGCRRVEKKGVRMGPAANDSTDSTGRGRGWGKKKKGKRKKKKEKAKSGQQAESSHHQSSAFLCNDALKSRLIDKMKK